ncbi:MAG: efflux RND transporter permease subunit [Deltaproteobacteria bacterium]|nr:efflux RND transporter permease subunit [Deltaproteobacteria bacterium]MCL5791550.1 efflux RND transporter permease subunit [Deltaproteobacteria bacterium]
MMFKKIVHFSLTHKFLILLIVLLLVTGGIFTYSRLDRTLLPDLNSPIFKIFISDPGLPSEYVEREITFPVEQATRGILGVEKVWSKSKIGLSVVIVKFVWGTNYFQALELLSQRISAIAPALPPEINPPVISNAADRMSEVIQYYLTGDVNSKELRAIAEYDVKYQLEMIPGIYDITNIGGEVAQYQILVNMNRLKSYDIGINSVVRAVRDNNVIFTGGYLFKGPVAYSIRGNGLIKNFNALSHIVVATRKNIPVYLGDVSVLHIGHHIRQGNAIVDDKHAVLGTVVKQYGLNAMPIIKSIKDRLNTIKKSMPEGVTLHTYNDQSTLINASITNLRDAIIIGTVAVIVIIFLIMADIYTTMVIAIIIPISIIITFIFMKLFNYSLNVMSLGGLVVGLGIMIDAAIIDTENIFRHLKMKPDDPIAATLEGSIEVRRPVVYSTIIIIAVFLPLYTLPGFTGAIFKDFSFTVVTSILIGFVLSLTLTPVLAYMIMKGRINKVKSESLVERTILKIYKPSLDFSLKHPVYIIGIMLSSLILVIASSGFIKTGFLPSIDEGAILVKVHMPPGTALSETTKRAIEISNILKHAPDVKDVIAHMGRPENAPKDEGVRKSGIFLKLVPWSKRKYTIAQIDNWIRIHVPSTKDVPIILTTPLTERLQEALSGIAVGGSLAIKIFGNDQNVLNENGARLYTMLSRIKGIKDLYIEQTKSAPGISIEINRSKLGIYGITPKQAGADIQTALAGRVATIYRRGIRQYDIFVRAMPEFRDSLKSISTLLIDEGNDKKIPLSYVADVRYQTTPFIVRRENMERVLELSCNISGRSTGAVINDINGAIKMLNLPPGYSVALGGEYRTQHDMVKRILLIMGVIAALIFIILYIAFDSLAIAGLVLVFIPFSLIGGVLALIITHTSLNISSVIGFLAHFGLSVQKAILLVEYILYNKASGMGDVESARHAGLTRMRPVLMTALSASVAVLPLALGVGTGAEIDKPMAVVLIGGLITSTIFTLIALPGIYTLIDKYRSKNE